METKKQYIAYMDILGYSAYIAENPDKANDYLKTITEAIGKVKNNVAGISLVGKNGFHTDVDIKCKTFSDNILLCMEATDNPDEIRRVIVFLISVASIQRGLVIEHNLLMRGGITIGELFINNDFVFGKGLIDAVGLEKKAENPCVIISDELLELCKGLIDIDQEGYDTIGRYVRAKSKGTAVAESDERYYKENGEKYVMGLFYYQSMQALVFHYESELPFLNYLFDMSDTALFGESLANFLIAERKKDPEKFKDFMVCLDPIPFIIESHRTVLISRINQYCHYKDVDKTNKKQVTEREKTIRKHIWVLRYHNSTCQRYELKQLMIPHHYGCDMNNLRTIVKVDI